MTDQQTSRTNITEALRAALERVLAVAMTEEEDWTPAVQDEWAAAAKQAGEVLALAAEPRSDAVTAPDEPSTEAGRTLLDVLHAVRVSGMSIRQCILAVEREARAASASVPPFGASKANPFTKKIDVVADTPEQGK